MKNGVFWNVTPCFNLNVVVYVRVEVFMAVTMKNGVFWAVTSCGSCNNRCFGGT
jgi:heterodisulfide reductase subunit C